MSGEPAPKRVVLTMNGQQLEFIERVRRTHYPDLTIAEMALRALEETEISDTGLMRERIVKHG